MADCKPNYITSLRRAKGGGPTFVSRVFFAGYVLLNRLKTETLGRFGRNHAPEAKNNPIPLPFLYSSPIASTAVPLMRSALRSCRPRFASARG